MPATEPTASERENLVDAQVILGLGVIALALLVLIGWAFDFALVKQIRQAWAPMTVDTSLGLLLAGLSIVILDGSIERMWRRNVSPPNSHKRLVFALSSGVVVLGLIGIITEFVPIPLPGGVQLHDLQDQSYVATRAMGLSTGISFMLLGSALIITLRKKPQGPVVSQLLAGVAGFIAFIAFLGYLFGVDELYHISSSTPMSLHTALGLMALSSALLISQSSIGPMNFIMGNTVGGYMTRRLAVGVLATNLILGWLTVELLKARELQDGTGVMVFITANILVSMVLIDSTGRDITQLEASRRGTERLLMELINSASAGIYVKDLQGKVIISNLEFEQAVQGFPGDGLSSKELEVLRTGHRAQGEEAVRVGSRSRTYITNRFPIYDEKDRVLGICGVMTDITTRKEYEEQIQRNERMLRTLSDAIPSIVLTARVDGSVDYFNQRWFDYTGMPKTGTNVSEWVKIIHPGDLERIRIAWRDAVARGAGYKCELRIRRRDGEYRWHLMQALPFKSEKGEVLEWFGSITDIDDQKRLSETLERKVAERTRELTNANRELEAFSYSVSHDLRAPLRSMDGFSQILLKKYGPSIDDTGRGYLNRVRSASQSMANLIDDLLTLSRVGRTEIVRERVDLTRMARELFEEKRRAEPERNARISVEDGLTAEGDESLLRIALANLIDNAWKYSSKKPESVISLSSEALPSGARQYTLRDNGAGFDMAHVGQLFKAFQRLHSPHEFPGTGIGLATASRIIERHGGAIWAEGRTGEGAEFHFTIGEAEKKS